MNPRAAINDLLPFQGSPFSRLGISPDADIMSYSIPCFGRSLSFTIFLAENVGFEPTVPFGITGFQDQPLKPLGQLSETVLDYINTEPSTCQALFCNFFYNFSNSILSTLSEEGIYRMCRCRIHRIHRSQFFFGRSANRLLGLKCFHKCTTPRRSDSFYLI